VAPADDRRLAYVQKEKYMGQVHDSQSPGVLGTLFFTAASKPPDYGQGFVVRFGVPPVVGDTLEVDQYSIKRVREEGLHVCRWRIVEVRHEVNLNTENETDIPVSRLWVVAHPLE
jgi:hypothetical protein